MVVSVAATFALYEVVRRFQTARFLFGMHPLTKRREKELRPAVDAVSS
jgi:hypothetical protein